MDFDLLSTISCVLTWNVGHYACFPVQNVVTVVVVVVDVVVVVVVLFLNVTYVDYIPSCWLLWFHWETMWSPQSKMVWGSHP